jgi:hypothetical protein
MHSRQRVAKPARFKHIPHTTSDLDPREASSTARGAYEQDAERRQAAHTGFWDREPLTDWQEFLLCRELDCSRRPRYNRGPRKSVQQIFAFDKEARA